MDVADAKQQIARNGVWGTCVDCPRGKRGQVFPERCRYFARGDHQIAPEECERIRILQEGPDMSNIHQCVPIEVLPGLGYVEEQGWGGDEPSFFAYVKSCTCPGADDQSASRNGHSNEIDATAEAIAIHYGWDINRIQTFLQILKMHQQERT